MMNTTLKRADKRVEGCGVRKKINNNKRFVRKGFAPHTGARAIPPTLLDT